MSNLPNHHQKKFRHLREVIIWLHSHICYVCFKKCEVLEVHHLNKNSKDHRLKNLIPVCKRCHIILGKMKVLNQIKTSEIIEKLQTKILQLKN